MSIVGLLVVEFYLPEARSLKEKRMVLRSVKDRLKTFNIAIAEIEYQDLWQRGQLGIVSIANTTDGVSQVLETMIHEIDRIQPGSIVRTQIDFLS